MEAAWARRASGVRVEGSVSGESSFLGSRYATSVLAPPLPMSCRTMTHTLATGGWRPRADSISDSSTRKPRILTCESMRPRNSMSWLGDHCTKSPVRYNRGTYPKGPSSLLISSGRTRPEYVGLTATLLITSVLTLMPSTSTQVSSASARGVSGARVVMSSLLLPLLLALPMLPASCSQLGIGGLYLSGMNFSGLRSGRLM
mmetsp:Transcript_3928/g.9926  ORF Transcript_3928/g.9926 Transcript_3928/m.9926 type:complete len:201 (+) Transcript_3928:5977-6579(+)